MVGCGEGNCQPIQSRMQRIRLSYQILFKEFREKIGNTLWKNLWKMANTASFESNHLKLHYDFVYIKSKIKHFVVLIRNQLLSPISSLLCEHFWRLQVLLRLTCSDLRCWITQSRRSLVSWWRIVVTECWWDVLVPSGMAAVRLQLRPSRHSHGYYGSSRRHPCCARRRRCSKVILVPDS